VPDALTIFSSEAPLGSSADCVEPNSIRCLPTMITVLARPSPWLRGDLSRAWTVAYKRLK